MTARRRPIRSVSVWIRRGWLAALLLIAFAAIQPAAAHGYLIRAIPTDRAVLERAPARVQYWFSEALEPEFSRVTVRDQAGQVVAEGGLSEQDDKLLTARLPTGLADGAYIVELRLAFASDGHVIVETRTFFVGAVVAGVGGAPTGDQAVPLEVLWRALLLIAVMLLVGLFALYTLVLVPSWGSGAHLAGGLPPRVMNRLYVLAFAALGLAVLANAIALIQQTMLLFGVDAGTALTSNLWNVVRIGTRFGDTWNWRMILLGVIAALLGAALYTRREQPALVRPFITACAWAAPLVVFTWSISAHAAGSLILPWLALFSDWLHGLGVGLWVGSVAAFTLIAPVALRPYSGETRRQALLAALRRLSLVALASAIVVIATGVYNASNWIIEVEHLTSPYSLTLGVKLLLVGLLLALGAAHHMALRPQRYARWSAWWRKTASFLPSLRLESAAAVLTLVLAAWVSATPVPQPTLPPQAPPPGGTQTIGGYTVTASVTPGGPGPNTYDVQVQRSRQPVDGLDVRVQLVNPTLERRGARHVAEASGDGLYVAAGAEIARSGGWWLLIDLREPAGTSTRAAFVIPIVDEAALQLSRPPGAIHLIALALVLTALGAALRGAAVRFWAWLKPSPLGAVAAVLGGAIAAAAIAGAIWLSALSDAQTEAALFPVPQLANPTLPDAESLQRGADAFAAACGWESQPRELQTLLDRLDRLRDEELFAFTRAGWRSLPACAAELSDDERWHIVNYLRSRQP